MDDIYISGNGKRPDQKKNNNQNNNQITYNQNNSPYIQRPNQGYSNSYSQQNIQHSQQSANNSQGYYNQNSQNLYSQQYSENKRPVQYNNAGYNPQQQRPTYNGNPQYPVQSRTPNAVARPNSAQMPSSNNGNQKPPRKKKSKITKTIISIFLVIAILFSGIFAVIYNIASKVDYNADSHTENIYIDDQSLVYDKKVTNILLIGVDGKSSDSSLRSDTMLLVSIDRNNKKLKLTSFLRDTWVLIPSTKEHAKLNASFAYGGPQLVLDTIEYNYNIKIDHYMLVGFDMFKTIIDSFGGIDVEVTEKEADFMRRTAKPTRNIQAGPNTHMNGAQALVYCRIRKLDSDFMRTFRQRKVIAAIIEKAKQSNIMELKEVADNVLSMVQTDISPFELTKLAFGLPNYMSYDIESERIPTEGSFSYETKRGQSVIAADLDKNRQFLHDYLYSEDTLDEDVTK